jgi:predicted AAA+ superfamily ATPase
MLKIMNKELIKELILENQRFIENIELVKRDYEVFDNLNYVFVGLRRAGKSYLLYQQIQNLLLSGHNREEILYFNFEDDRIDGLSLPDLDLLKRTYEEMFDHKPFRRNSSDRPLGKICTPACRPSISGLCNR